MRAHHRRFWMGGFRRLGGTFVEDMSVNHCGFYVFVAEELLDGANVIPHYREKAAR